MTFVQRFICDEDGATAIEYSLIAGFIALVLVGAVRAIGLSLAPKFGAVSDGLS